MADKKVSLNDLTIFNDEALVLWRKAVELLEASDTSSPTGALQAVGTVTFTTIPFLYDIFTIGPQSFIWMYSRLYTGEVAIGVNPIESANNFITVVNIDLAGIVTCTYNGLVNNFPTVLVTSVVPGVIGNSIIFKNTV